MTTQPKHPVLGYLTSAQMLDEVTAANSLIVVARSDGQREDVFWQGELLDAIVTSRCPGGAIVQIGDRQVEVGNPHVAPVRLFDTELAALPSDFIGGDDWFVVYDPATKTIVRSAPDA